MEKYYRRLRELREENNMTQEQIAEYLDKDARQYRRYESGKSDIPTDLLRRLARLYNTSTDYILELTDDPRPYSRVIYSDPTK